MGRMLLLSLMFVQGEDGIRDATVTGVQTCALPISQAARRHRDTISSPPVESLWVERLAGDRKSVVEGKRVELGGRRIIKKKKTHPATGAGIAIGPAVWGRARGAVTAHR